MDSNIWSTLIGLSAGALGYWFSTFSVAPIIRYWDVRNKIHRDFIYYAQVISPQGLNEKFKTIYEERLLVNRDSSARLSAAYLELPCWFKLYLKIKKLDPLAASSKLIGFSNTTEFNQAAKIQDFIRKKLGLPPET